MPPPGLRRELSSSSFTPPAFSRFDPKRTPNKRTNRGGALVRKSHSAHEFQHVPRELGRGINPPLQGPEIPSEKAPQELAPGSLRSPDQIFVVVGCALTSIALPPLVAARKNSARLSAAAGASYASTCRYLCGSDRLFRCFV